MPITDKISRATDSATIRPVIAKLGGAGKTIGASSITLSIATSWTTTSKIYFAIYLTNSAGIKDPATQTDWTGDLTGTTITNLTLTGGVDRPYTTDAYVELTLTAAQVKDLYDWGTTHANPDGTLKSTAVSAALNLGSGSLAGWNPLGYTFDTVTYNGNRSYTGVINSQDVTGILSAGMRLRTTRTVEAPIQSVSLNGTSQYFSKSAPAGMTEVNNFVRGAWVKLTSYQNQTISSKYDGTSGWSLEINGAGQVVLRGFNNGAANERNIQSYKSVPLNKWVHVTAQLDMLSFTATPTTSYVMFDGVDVPAVMNQNGTNPTAILQAGNLEIGSRNGGLQPLSGKIVQAFVTSAKLTQTQARAIYSQGLTSALVTSNSIISAYSLSGATGANDLNTTNANNLIANGGVTTTNADAPFGDSGTSTILDCGIISAKPTFSTNTTIVFQVPEGCTVPTSGGVASVAYSNVDTPYGFPKARNKWTIQSLNITDTTYSFASSFPYYNAVPGLTLSSLPVGEWSIEQFASVSFSGTIAAVVTGRAFLTTETALPGGAFSTGEAVALSRTPGRYSSGASVLAYDVPIRMKTSLTVTTPITVSSGYRMETGGGSFQMRHFGVSIGAISYIEAENAYL